MLFISEPAPASLSLVIFHGFRRGSLHFGSILKFERQLHPRLYYFEDEFTHEELKRHYDFYETLTVHESSLSPCIHSILAAKLGDEKRAYDFYLRTARLDLNDYNNDTRDGLHITSMAGTWMTIIKGFAGMEVKNDQLTFKPLLPKNWESLSFKINFRDKVKHVFIDRLGLKINE